jgi:hypothetical protein
MLNKILFVIALGFFVGLAPANADTPAAPARVKGQIIAARIQGHVDAVSKANGQRRALHDGDAVTEQTQIVTAAGANAILVFSNGATVNIAGDSSLDIEQFDQDPFASEQKVSEMKQEPSTSTTRLNLTKGELVGKVVHLNVDRGSEFTVQTPVGAAGIRGTTFRIVFRPDPGTGKAFFEVTTTDGRVLFTGVTSGPVNIPAGKQVVSTFNYTPPTTPGGTGTATNVVIPNVTDVSVTEAAQITTATQQIVAAVNPIVFTSVTTTTAPVTPPTTNNTPSLPVVPAPATTPGAGGP